MDLDDIPVHSSAPVLAGSLGASPFALLLLSDAQLLIRPCLSFGSTLT